MFVFFQRILFLMVALAFLGEAEEVLVPEKIFI